MTQTISAREDDLLLTERQKALPSHLRARHAAVNQAFHAVKLDTSNRDLARVARTILRLLREARKGGQRWDRAWVQARRDVGHLIDGDMTDAAKNLFYAVARGQA